MFGIIAQLAGNPGAWSFGQVLIAIVVIAACIALVFVACRQFGITIPGWLIQVFWIVAVAVVVIFAIKLLLGL